MPGYATSSSFYPMISTSGSTINSVRTTSGPSSTTSSRSSRPPLAASPLTAPSGYPTCLQISSSSSALLSSSIPMRISCGSTITTYLPSRLSFGGDPLVSRSNFSSIPPSLPLRSSTPSLFVMSSFGHSSTVIPVRFGEPGYEPIVLITLFREPNNALEHAKCFSSEIDFSDVGSFKEIKDGALVDPLVEGEKEAFASDEGEPSTIAPELCPPTTTVIDIPRDSTAANASPVLSCCELSDLAGADAL
ncbi:hypothetical protein Cni_G07161 [Canna indica]|uniref:Uncharacterized protein n=1 Tax=Canna indica TaxID=4628 RepID=A0AAQ3JY01_9LILI|nr:hypothetical protein Cni_G07161 [Canna indica]